MKSAREGPCSLFLNVSKFILFLALFCPFSLSAANVNPPLKGYFQSGSGDKCRYQTVYRLEKYFADLEQRICLHTFDDPGAMPKDDLYKRMIANGVARFYVEPVFQADTHFKTDPAEWNPAAGLQKKGFSITARNYPPPSIWIDFVLSPDKQKIVRVVHGKGMNF